MRRSDCRRPTTTTAALLLLALAGCGDGGTQPNAPSGTLLVTTFDGEHEAIEVVRADGRGRRRLTAAGISEFDAAWSPDGRRIAFIRQAPNESAHLFVMNADGSDVRQLTTGCDPAVRPRWSPDGRFIAYDGYVCGEEPVNVYVIGSDGSNPHVITSGNATLYDWDADWSPDGSRILYRSFRESGQQVALYLVNPDGTGETPLVADGAAICAGNIFNARWSPDGTRIAYTCGGGDVAEGVYVMAADGTNPVRLSGPADAAASDAVASQISWAPDGKSIAFARLWDHEAAVYVTPIGQAGAAGAAVGPLLSDPHYVAVTSWGAPR